MRIIGIAVVGANEKYLEKMLGEFQRLCDDAIIATNNADNETIELIETYGFSHYEDNREWGKTQPLIKTDLLKKAGELNPDWIIALDADEVFAPEFTREEAERLANLNEIAYYFMIVNLYNDEEHFAHSTGIQRFWNVRFYKYMPEFGLQFQKKALHCGLGPPITYMYGWHAPYYVAHYGLMLKEDRIRKYNRYMQYDPNRKYKSNNYYDELIKDLPPRPFDREGLLRKLRETPETQFREKPPKPKIE
jgi:hypothetical protein